MSTYRKYLEQLSAFSDSADNAAVSDLGFIDLQKLEADINEGRRRGEYTAEQAKNLRTIASYVHERYIDTLIEQCSGVLPC